MSDAKPPETGLALVQAEARDFWGFAVHLANDTLKNIALLGAMSGIFFFAEWLKRNGMEAEHIRRIELLHFWLTFSGLLWIGAVFLVKLVMRACK